MRTPDFGHAKTKAQISFAAKLISAFVFATRIVQFLYFLNPKCQASSAAAQIGLCQIWSEIPKIGFCRVAAKFVS